jgi:hypothetical protein
LLANSHSLTLVALFSNLYLGCQSFRGAANSARYKMSPVALEIRTPAKVKKLAPTIWKRSCARSSIGTKAQLQSSRSCAATAKVFGIAFDGTAKRCLYLLCGKPTLREACKKLSTKEN